MTATARPPKMRLSIDAWDPSYGSSGDGDGELDRSPAVIEEGIEVPPERWAPIDPDPTIRLPSAVMFVDGVMRVDARAWVDEPVGGARFATQGMCASYAAGAVCCCSGRAHLVLATIRRGLFATATHVADLPTRVGTYEATVAKPEENKPDVLTLRLALQSSLNHEEILAATDARTTEPGHRIGADDDLLVVDGPLRDRQHLPRALGYVKSHRRTYLPPPLNAIVGSLAARQRTPVFLMGTSWKRNTWYLRLPGEDGAPWAGIVRIECGADLDLDAVVGLANLSQVTLPRYASVPYKDKRAPQNLYPIGGLEKTLRHRLGDANLLYRALRLAAANGG
jgi:hypothetical protein